MQKQTYRTRARLPSLLALLGLLGGCMLACQNPPSSSSPRQESSTSRGPVVAQIDTGSITQDEVQRSLSQLPADMRQKIVNDKSRLKAFVEDGLQQKVLVAEARALGLQKDPTLRARMDNVLATAMRARLQRNNPHSPALAVNDVDVRAFYQKHLQDYTLPKRWRVAFVRFSTRDAAQKARHLLLSRPVADRPRFIVAWAKSAPGGTALLAALTKADLVHQGPSLWQAVQSLADQAGSVSKVLQVGTAFKVIALVEAIAPSARLFVDVAPSIRKHLAEEKRQSDYRHAVDALLKAHHARVFDDVLNAANLTGSKTQGNGANP